MTDIAATKFWQDHDCIAVCGNFRYGSTALGTKLQSWAKQHNDRVLFLNEFFTLHHFLDDPHGAYAPNFFPVDHLQLQGSNAKVKLTIDRPIPDNIFRAKCDWLRDKMRDIKIILKIDPDDWQGLNGRELERFILDNPRVFAIGLNRQDIGNAMISYLIGVRFNFWNFGKDDLALALSEPVQPITVGTGEMQEFVRCAILHNNWLWYMRDRLGAMVWYEDIQDLRIPELGIRENVWSWSTRNDMDHHDRARRYFVNHDAVIAMAQQLQQSLEPLLTAVRRRYS